MDVVGEAHEVVAEEEVALDEVVEAEVVQGADSKHVSFTLRLNLTPTSGLVVIDTQCHTIV